MSRPPRRDKSRNKVRLNLSVDADVRDAALARGDVSAAVEDFLRGWVRDGGWTGAKAVRQSTERSNPPKTSTIKNLTTPKPATPKITSPYASILSKIPFKKP